MFINYYKKITNRRKIPNSGCCKKNELRDLVLARLKVMSDSINVSIGSKQLNKKDLISHVEKEDKLGQQIMLIELEFLQDLASGKIYESA